MTLPTDVKSVLWDLGDGNTSTLLIPNHVYQAPGVYTAILTAFYTDGTSASVEGSVPVTASEWDVTGLNVSKTNVCYRFGTSPKEGIGFSEVSGDGWVLPNGRVEPITLKDNNNVPRLVVLDANSRRFYEITTSRGSDSLGHTPVWKDKVSIDNTGGINYSGGFTARGVEGELERYFLELISTNLYTRPLAEEIRNNDGVTVYDTNGYPEDLLLKFKMSTEDQKAIPDVEAQKVSMPKHEVTYDKRIEGHFINTEIEWNVAPFQIVGLTQNLLAKDKLDTPTNKAMVESSWQEHVANVQAWYSRGSNLLLDRATGQTNSIDPSEVTATVGPDGYSDSAFEIAAAATIDISDDYGVAFFWYRDDTPVASLPVGFTAYKTVDNWTLAYVENGTSLSFGEGAYFDIRSFSTDVTLDLEVVEYLYEDVASYQGIVNLPVWF